MLLPLLECVMTAQSDPAVTVTIVATALNRSEKTLTLAYMAGELPPPDSTVRDSRNRARIRGWRLSTIHAWNPAVAMRCAAILEALESFPLKAA